MSLVYLGGDGRPVETKTAYEIKGSDVVVLGDMIVGPVTQLQNGNKFLMNFARSKDEKFDYKMNLQNSNGLQIVTLNSVKTTEAGNWPNGIVPIKFEDSVKGNVSLIAVYLDSFNNLMKNNDLKLKLVPYNSQSHFVSIRNNNDSCSATTGFKSSYNLINLGSGCVDSRVIHHELLHILGFNHEQTRSDRNDFVTISEENILDESLNNFTILNNSMNFSDYDYESIMHYNSYAFSKNGLPTILIKGTNEDIEENYILSRGDIEGVRESYGSGAYSDQVSFQDEVVLPLKPITGILHNPDLPEGAIENQQYIADGYTSKVYKYSNRRVCRVPDGHFYDVKEKSATWINQLISSTGGKISNCDMKPVGPPIYPGIALPEWMKSGQQYIAKGYTSRVYKLSNGKVCRVLDGDFYDVKEISQRDISTLVIFGKTNHNNISNCVIN